MIVPPAVFLLVAAAVTAVVPRRIGHAAGVLAALGALVVALTTPLGTVTDATLFGFPARPVAVDGFARVVGGVLAFIAAANTVYAYGSGADRQETAIALAYAGASLGAVFAGDWLTLVVCWELMAVAATVLVWRSTAGRAGYRYAVYHQIGGALLIAGVVAHYAATGSFVYAAGIATGLPRVLATAGVLVNVGMLGVHVWIVDTYPRPSVTTSVVLCGFTTKVGVYTLVRVVPGRNVLLAYAGGTMLLFGVTMAILQTDFRRLLSYHIVSQVGYMVAGVGVASGLGYGGAMAHLANNVLYKTLLFMIAGVVLIETGTENLKRLGGLGRAMPATAAAFAVAALAISGIPGFSGFVSKGMVVDSVDAAGLDALWWMLLVGGVGTVISFAKIAYYAFVRADQYGHDPGRATPAQITAMGGIAAVVVGFGLFPDLLLDLLPAGRDAAKVFAASQFEKALGIAAVGLVAFAVLRRPLKRITAVPDLDSVYHPAGAVLRDSVVRAATGVADTLGRSRRSTGVAIYRAASVDVGRPASIGRSVLLLTLVAALVVVFLLS
ncbi:proton-conducting transporter transmembrane domain-containing protein [Halapricum hydrolyticum]|uniref:Proton-conducting transporter membrane subunit n=1 Tax=Halapricum hydrolyticum TaxID=2979991 RepID=A0AAE3ICG9_9EURY|nr:proton-conducting transporter membrane subunit [Halapricum hydrolyticum]MCU4718771.1 proton-conducting transporter membrane subunit [Halapricum hydrolyticum]MCU4727821.1 proton-conducting transporter membrane subunit [Halapricum hydrolyticum]